MDNYRMEIVTFEYNEEQRIFHENVGDSEENTNGYKTICKTYYYIWEPFRRLLSRSYTFDRPVPFREIEMEWESYMALRKDIDECNSTQESQ